MAFPQSLQVRPLGLTPTDAGGGGPSGASLTLALALQEQSLWCWAAVSAAIGNFFSTGTWTQCQVATTSIPNFVPPRTGTFDCCADARPCNIYGFLDVALTTTRSFASKQPAPMTLVDVQTEIAESQPVGARIQWRDGSGHFVAVHGWWVDPSGAPWLDVADPQTGPSVQRLSTFPTSYRTGGTWTHSYRTHNQTL